MIRMYLPSRFINSKQIAIRRGSAIERLLRQWKRGSPGVSVLSFPFFTFLFLLLCRRYLGHVDLMKFLVESNCGDIPSLRDLMHPDSAR